MLHDKHTQLDTASDLPISEQFEDTQNNARQGGLAETI